MTLQLPRVVFAAGALGALPAELQALGVRRPMLVSDRGLDAAGLVAQTTAERSEVLAWTQFIDVTENPLFADADRGVVRYRRHGCDGVVALGGGSVIDTAKFIALLAANGGRTANYAGMPNVVHSAAAPLIAIPTTAGTGSEASPSAGIHPDATTAAVGLSSRHLVPRVAILDPDLTRTLPRRLVASTGIDALSHCIEGYFSRKAVPLGKAIALDGIARVAHYLRRAVASPDDDVARAEMMLAAFAGGVSIGMGLGPAHAMALTCSDQGFHHGVLSGIGLVATLDVTVEHAREAAADIALAFGLRTPDSLSQALGTLMRELQLPATLAELAYEADDVAALAAAAHRSHFNVTAPVHPTKADYTAMFAASLAPEPTEAARLPH